MGKISKNNMEAISGHYSGQYNDLEGSWQDGDVQLKLMPDGTYTCARQYNNGRDDPGYTSKYSGNWEVKGATVIITPRPKDFKTDFTLDAEKNMLTFRIEHIGYETPQTDLKLH